jgi:hypothetical protein
MKVQVACLMIGDVTTESLVNDFLKDKDVLHIWYEACYHSLWVIYRSDLKRRWDDLPDMDLNFVAKAREEVVKREYEEKMRQKEAKQDRQTGEDTGDIDSVDNPIS